MRRALCVYVKNCGRSPANVFGLRVDAKYQGQHLGSHDLGTASMGLLPGQEQPIKGLLNLSGNPSARDQPPDPVILEAPVDYMMDTTPAVLVRYITTAIIELTKHGQFLTHQVLTSEPVHTASDRECPVVRLNADS